MRYVKDGSVGVKLRKSIVWLYIREKRVHSVCGSIKVSALYDFNTGRWRSMTLTPKGRGGYPSVPGASHNNIMSATGTRVSGLANCQNVFDGRI